MTPLANHIKLTLSKSAPITSVTKPVSRKKGFLENNSVRTWNNNKMDSVIVLIVLWLVILATTILIIIAVPLPSNLPRPKRISVPLLSNLPQQKQISGQGLNNFNSWYYALT